jgi:hypothetical protein
MLYFKFIKCSVIDYNIPYRFNIIELFFSACFCLLRCTSCAVLVYLTRKEVGAMESDLQRQIE